jgi:molybdopterin-guanine dinucleotide biosynthesis protein A
MRKGHTLLARALAAVPPSSDVFVIGPPREGFSGITWVREEPPDGGPAHALGAALPHVRSERFFLLASDLPLVGPAALDALAGAAEGDAVLALDSDSRAQPLLGLYRTEALREARPEPFRPGASMMALLEGLDVVRVAVGPAADDCDTAADARRLEVEVVAR